MELSKQERFLKLLEPVRRDLSQFCLAMTRDRERGRDLMSDTVLVAYERFETLKEERAFVSFLFTIARRTCRRSVRRRRLFGEYDQRMAEALPDTTGSEWISTDIAALYDALAKLPEKQRETVVMFEIAGLSLDEIREVQGGSLSAVKSRLVRGRRALSRLLGVDDELDGLEGRSAAIRRSERDDAPDFSPSNDQIMLHTANGGGR